MEVKKKELVEKANELFYDDRLRLLKMIKDAGAKISKSSDGSRVMLDRLQPELIDKLHAFMLEKLKVPPENQL